MTVSQSASGLTQLPAFPAFLANELHVILNPTPFLVWLFTKLPIFASVWLAGFAVVCDRHLI